MTGRTKRFVAVGVTALILIATIAIGFSFRRPSATTRLPITFVSFTNSAAGGPTAVFLITNPYPKAVSFCVVLPQVHSASGWPEDISPPPFPIGVVLAGNQFTNFAVSVPTNGSWRVPVLSGFVLSQVDLWRELVKVNWSVYRETGTLPGRTGDRKSVV